MAYTGEVRIDDDAANADIQKIRAAITKLEESLSKINRLQASAESMTGQTGTAISEKCMQLNAKITSLIQNLNKTISLIQGAVEEKHQQDHQAAAGIRMGGGI